MWLDFLLEGLIFWGAVLGAGWPLAARLQLDPAEKLLAAVALSLLGVFLFAWLIYAFALPVNALRLLPVLVVIGLASNVRSLTALLRDSDARALLIAQFLVTAWCVGWLALVITYSGAWVGDWFTHWERTRFFLERWPRETLYYGFDPVPSRPPMANVITGALLFPVGATFAGYQLVTTLLGSLAFLPAAVLARRFQLRPPGAGGAQLEGRSIVAVLAVLFMVNPLFVQNATFAWTKLPAAFFVLGALYFFLRVHDADSPRAAAMLCATLLAAGILVHYSAGPYALILAGAWLGLGRTRLRDPAWWRMTASAAAIGAVVLLSWFGWSFTAYGGTGTFLSNSAIVEQAPTAAEQTGRILPNLRDTIVPHFLRTVDFSSFAQSSPWGWWRDWWFHLYQTNLPFACGSVAFVALVALAMRDGRRSARERTFWIALGAGVVVLGAVVEPLRIELGVAHICLQPLVLLGLAYLAARWPTLSRAWRLALVAGAAADFGLGIALHFGVQSGGLDHWLRPAGADANAMLSYSQFAIMNLRAKLQNQWIFFGDYFAAHAGWLVAALGAVFALALARTRRRQP